MHYGCPTCGHAAKTSMPMKNNTSMTMNLPNARANLGESAIRMRNKRIVCIFMARQLAHRANSLGQ